MKRVHRVDREFGVVRRTEQRDMMTLQERRQRRDRHLPMGLGVVRTQRPDHHTTVAILHADDRLVARVTESDSELVVQAHTGARALVDEGAIGRTPLQHTTQVVLHREVQVAQEFKRSARLETSAGTHLPEPVDARHRHGLCKQVCHPRIGEKIAVHGRVELHVVVSGHRPKVPFEGFIDPRVPCI